MKKPPVRVHHMLLSQWQSVVYKTAQELYAENPDMAARVIAANDAFVTQADTTPLFPRSKPVLTPNLPPQDASIDTMSKEQLSAFLEFAFFYTVFPKKKSGDDGKEMKSDNTLMLSQVPSVVYESDNNSTFDDEDLERPYSDEKTMTFISHCGANYTWSWIWYDKAYNSWKKEGNNNINYGCIDWQIPKNGKVAIIGDWGTGMDDGKALLADIVTNHKPDAIIHLGDIYYAGTETECRENFTQIITDVFNENNGGTRIPFFSIPGNHEYYSYGNPYFDILPDLNSQDSTMLQQASYLRLKVKDTDWQFLAMDTGYNDASPYASVGDYDAPALKQSEKEWLADKLKDDTVTTILLSHHQLFSANAKVNKGSDYSGDEQYKNNHLYKMFQPYFSDRIAAWIWGHEHNMAIYQNGLLGLAKGRLVGASAYQETWDEYPYTVNCSDFPYASPMVMLYTNEEWLVESQTNLQGQEVIEYRTYYDHGYAILDFSTCNDANGQVTATYYDFPSWYNNVPTNPASTQIFQETFSRPSNLAQPALKYGDSIMLKTGGHFLGPVQSNLVGKTDNYGDNFQIIAANGSTGTVKDSDQVYIVHTSPLLGNNNRLRTNGNDATDYLTYANDSGDSCTWYIKKEGGKSGDTIHYGDQVHFTSKKESGYTLYNEANTNQLNLNSSKWLTFNIMVGATLPHQTPIAYLSSSILLQVGHGYEWSYLTNAEQSGSTWNAKLITEQELADAKGVGTVPLIGITMTNKPDNDVNLGTTTVTLPDYFTDGDTIMLCSTENLISGNTTYLTAPSSAGHKVTYSNGSNMSEIEWIVRKVDTSNDTTVRENDLVQLHCVVNGNTFYLSTGTSNGSVYAAATSSPVYCRFSYQEAS